MSNKYQDSCIPSIFAQKLLAEAYYLPAALLRRYRQWGLDERELIVLLRLAGPIMTRGAISLADIGAEFEVDEIAARTIIQPYLDNRMLELDDGRCTCDGLMRDLYQDWAADQRVRRGAGKSRAKTKTVNEAENERIRVLGLLYRRFEQEFGRNLKYTENERIRFWLDEESISPELVEEALKRAVLQNKCSFAYIDSILKQWQDQNLLSLEMVEKFDVKPQTAPPAARSRTTKKASTNKYDSFYDEILR